MKRKEKRIQLRSMGYVAPAMLLLIFLLCFNLVQQILVFIQSIYKELSYRW